MTSGTRLVIGMCAAAFGIVALFWAIAAATSP